MIFPYQLTIGIVGILSLIGVFLFLATGIGIQVRTPRRKAVLKAVFFAEAAGTLALTAVLWNSRMEYGTGVTVAGLAVLLAAVLCIAVFDELESERSALEKVGMLLYAIPALFFGFVYVVGEV